MRVLRVAMLHAPTPHAPINDLLRQLLDGIRSVLGDHFVGLYLSGSLAFGDFDPTSSDIDFVAAICEPLDEAAVAALQRMHEELGGRGGEQGAWAHRLEGFYVPLAPLRRHDPATSRHAFFAADTRFGKHRLGWDWVINRYVVREHGVVVDGPPPATLIDPISREQLLGGVRGALRHEWSRHVDGSEWMRSRHEQAFVVLTMCRALYVLDRGAFVSKPEAADWAQRHLAPEWTPLIQRALAWRKDATLDDAALPETLRFLRFTLSQS
jgi:Domain of unknown function (DUF4111)